MVAILKFHKPTPLQIFQQKLFRKKPKVTAGTHVTDMAELRKCLVLCMTCEGRFGARKYGYQRARDIPICRGECDGCGEYFGCATFLRPLD